MLVKEFNRKREDGKDLFKTYSDENFMIRKVGTDELYEVAIDVENYEYEETDIHIEYEDIII